MYKEISGDVLARMRELLTYNKESGVFTWKHSGKVAGGISGGYIEIQINKVRFKAHRMAWAFVYDECPSDMEIDHENLNRADNRISSLRLATKSQNGRNKKAKSNNKTGVKGVYYDGQTGKYRAEIQVNGKRFKLGRFLTIDDAAKAYRIATEKYHGEFMRTE
ncbi:homing endonuclease [Yersinia phage vB_YenM_636]|nr:homing endonuclease [Yersinia phage vB_YenM_12]QKN86431.1 homing endonuclease [Yersinia phage vB_YenM_22]QKN86522.1 homing endonuclease [Yersinia phage vB_YenM_25]QKN86613.1 homing endonuclease [Yersinia phage vB_YenM_27]QKN86704.1 homing endonuclease [Yersinia phage vB_YenM_39]QKN86795.1 homing endonuclease [Yersinia phage vB_YenM_126]QKN86886.1 homing endonuclease [Yersinia phage vB_YenM_526-1]QKN86977.1 homing endonuclease [Yersinia phage vB_YenM_526-2]QKN87160.1 homing endonuclease [